jgi:hypothetical protein
VTLSPRFGLPPLIVNTPLAQHIGDLVSLIERHPDGREIFIQCAAYSHQTSFEDVETHLATWCQHAPEGLQ